MGEAAIERVVLITGAASGIGAATARRLAAPGTALFLTTRANGDGLAAVAAAAEASGALVERELGDLTESGMAEQLVAAAQARFGRLDQLVSNAGRAQKARFGEIGTAEITAAVAVNTLPFVALVTAALPALEVSDWGRIVAVSSFVAHDIGVNGTLFPATAAGKGALEALARSLAFQLARAGVTVNCVAPGFTRKDGGHAALPPAAWEAAAQATPSGRIAEPVDIAAAIDFLLSRDARHITGQILRVDGGLSLL
jgi:NAD(P)-dependent dehydrogenase (short-subunit alcohol dehydrogenase family)